MEIFTAKQTFNASGEFIPMAMKHMEKTFNEKGYKLRVKSESFDRTVIEIQRGCVLHQAFGLRNGLEITFTRNGDQTDVEVRDCLIENQVIGPGLLFYYVPKLRIPIVVTESIGLVMQAKLPQKAISAITEAYQECTGEQPVFCPYCGARVNREDGVCSSCGKSLFAEVVPVK